MLEQHIQDWYNSFKEQIGQSDPESYSSPFVDLDRPDDRCRVLVEDPEAPDGIRPALPLNGELSEDDIRGLYNKAVESELFVLPLGSVGHNLLQVSTKPENMIREVPMVRNEPMVYQCDHDIVEPELQELSFFKWIFNSLFNLFEEERQRYQEEYDQKYAVYEQDVAAHNFTYAYKQNLGTLAPQREAQMLDNCEAIRRDVGVRLEATRNLRTEDLPQWKKEALDAKIELLENIANAGEKVTTEQMVDKCVIVVVESMLDKNKQLAAEIESKPENLQILKQIIKDSEAMRVMPQQANGKNNAMLAGVYFTEMPKDKMVGNFKQELKDRNIAAKMLAKEGLRPEATNTLEGIKELFADEKVAERMNQLRHARSRIPEEKLVAVTTVNAENGTKKEIVTKLNLAFVDLDDPLVLEVYNNDQQQRQQEGKIASQEGPQIG